MSFEIDDWIQSFGYIGVWTIIFAETGILFGVLLPGDSLLIAAGILAAHGHFDISIMAFGCFMAALVGNLCGYGLGHKWGKPFLEKYGPELTTTEKIARTYEILRKYQVSGTVISRFLPVARTFAPFLAGVIHMRFGAFFLYSAIGAALWGAGLTYTGFYLGEIMPKWILDVMIVPIAVFLLATVAWPWVRRRFKKDQ